MFGIANPYIYTGRRLGDETGLYYYRNGYYHAQMGRFITWDPIGYAGGDNLYEYVRSRPVRAALPRSAGQVHESYQPSFPDYVYYLKARISSDDFKEYVDSLGLNSVSAENLPADFNEREFDRFVSWSGDESTPDWWNPKKSRADTWVRGHGDSWTFANYEDGWIFVKSLTH